MARGEPIEGLNPEVLRWARRTLGLTPADVAQRMKREEEEIVAWEAGESCPTYAQLEWLAYKVYKRPVAAFFLPDAPEEPNPGQAFRTLPGPILQELAPDTRLALREAVALQGSLEELHEGTDGARSRIVKALHTTWDRTSPTVLAGRVRSSLGVSLDDQAGWASVSVALDRWRSAVGDSGVFVFKRSFVQREIVGFSLGQGPFPVIMLNNGHSKSRQIFTLFHELGHVLTGGGSLTVEEGLAPSLGGPDYWQGERLCNEFASFCLMPVADFLHHTEGVAVTASLIQALAKRYKVSKESVARRFVERDRLSQSDYLALADEYNREYLDSRPATSAGGDYYRTQVQYLGTSFMTLAFSSFYRGTLSHSELASHLGVKPKSIPRLEAEWLRKVQAT